MVDRYLAGWPDPDQEDGGCEPPLVGAVEDARRLGPSGWRARIQGVEVVVRRLPGLAGSGSAEALRQMIDRAAGVAEVVVPLAVYEEEHSVVVVRPWVDGTPVGSAPDPMAAHELAGHSAEIARRVEHLKRKLAAASCYHGSIRPSNVLVRPDGELAVVDQGLAAVSEGLAPDDMARLDAEGFRQLLRVLGASRPHERSQFRPRASRRLSALVGSAVVVLGASGFAVVAHVTSGKHRECPARPPGAASVSGLDGACPAAAAWSSGTGRLVWAGGTLAFTVGGPGDVFLVGRWTCRPLDLPAIYRPSTGQVWIFPSWPTAGEVRSLPARRIAPAVDPAHTGISVIRSGPCDKVRIG